MRVGADLAVVDAPVQLSLGTQEQDSTAATDGSHDLVVWRDVNDFLGGTIVNATGQIAPGTQQKLTSPTGGASDGEAAAAFDGQDYYLVWRREPGSSTAPITIQGTRVDVTGSRVGPTLQLAP